MKLKKLSMTLLAALLAAALCAGCAGGGNPTQPATAATTAAVAATEAAVTEAAVTTAAETASTEAKAETTAATTAAPAATEAAAVAAETEPAGTEAAPAAADESAPEEHVTLSVAFWDFMTADDPMIKILESKCNVTVEPRPLSWDNDEEQIMLWAAGDDLPDLIATYSIWTGANRLYNWIDQGLVRSIPYEMTSRYPRLKQMTDASEAVNAIKNLKGGEYWYIPRLDSAQGIYKAQQTRIYYRKDWLKNVGIDKTPETIDECYEMWRAFTYDDPNGSGVKDTIGYSQGRGVPSFLVSFGIDRSIWYKQGDQWVPGYFCDGLADGIDFIQKMYREGILDPEFTIMSGSQMTEKITTNVAGSFISNGDIYQVNNYLIDTWGAANPGQDPLEVWGILPPPKRSADKPAVWQTKIDVGANEISYKVDDKKLDRIMYVMEYILSPEGQNLKLFGIEGETYDVVNGKVELRLNPQTGEFYDLYTTFPSAFFFDLCEWGFDYLASDSYIGSIAQNVRDYSWAATELYNAACDPDITFTPGLMSTPAKDNLTITAGDDIIAIIIGEEDARPAFAAFQQDCLNKNLQSAIDEVTAEMNAIGQ